MWGIARAGLALSAVFGSLVSFAQLVPELPATRFNYANPSLPAHFRQNDVLQADNTPANNPITDAGATLGRVLFYDKRLSKNDTISCASCHLQTNGFSDPGTRSTGFAGGLTARNSMGLANARFYDRGRFFWDERAATLEDQVLMPIQDSVEMGLTLNEMVTKVRSAGYYDSLFVDAFGSSTVTADRVSRALSQFVRSILSYRSKFDVGQANGFTNFTAQENQGRQLFNSNRTRCSDCHETALQIMDQPRNIGLDRTTTDAGAGAGRFKASSLRNIELTAPFMHDGRFATLEQVVAFYNGAIQAHPNLDNRLRRRDGQPVRMGLSGAEQNALVAFMKTLTDNDLTNDVKFSDPFVEDDSIIELIVPVLLRRTTP